MLKLYCGEDVIRQNPEYIDQDRWLDEGELTDVPEIPREEAEVGVREQPTGPKRPELYPEPDQDIPILPEDPEIIAEREGIHKRIQAEIQQENKEAEVVEEVMFEIPPEWNAVQDLIMEDNEGIIPNGREIK